VSAVDGSASVVIAGHHTSPNLIGRVEASDAGFELEALDFG
jgi:hypothetical protein